MNDHVFLLKYLSVAYPNYHGGKPLLQKQVQDQ